MSEEDIRRIAREENKPFLDRIMELQDILKDREEYCDKLEENRENILIENKKYKEVIDKIKEQTNTLLFELNRGKEFEKWEEILNPILELLEEVNE